jgi:hypothetical protein
MARGYPSVLALLGLAAFAGYQNREKISKWISDKRNEYQTRNVDFAGDTDTIEMERPARKTIRRRSGTAAQRG